jgi:hypothetical protein
MAGVGVAHGIDETKKLPAFGGIGGRPVRGPRQSLGVKTI